MTLKSSIKKGRQNVVEDALSRKYDDVDVLLCDISIIQVDWVVGEWEGWNNYLLVWMLIQKLQKDPTISNTSVRKSDSLWYKNQLYICNNPKSNKRSF